MRHPPKTYEQALAEMIRTADARFQGQFDPVEGAVLLSLLEATAFQVADLSDRQEDSITKAIPEAVYAAFGFPRREASTATGALTFTAPAPAPVPAFIPAGTEAKRDDGTVYATLEDALLEIGQSAVSVPASCTTPGLPGNANAGTVTRLLSSPPGIQRVTNTLPFTGGQDAETPAEQRARFAAWVDTLDQSSIPGLTRALLDVNLPQVGRLQEVLIVDGETDPSIPAGTFKAFLYRKGGIPGALLTQLVSVTDARRAAGCLPTLIEVPGTPVPVSFTLTVRQLGTSAHARAALDVYFSGLAFGQKVSRENLITALTTAHPDILEVTLHAPAEDVPCGPYAHLELGTVTVAESVSASGRA